MLLLTAWPQCFAAGGWAWVVDVDTKAVEVLERAVGLVCRAADVEVPTGWAAPEDELLRRLTPLSPVFQSLDGCRQAAAYYTPAPLHGLDDLNLLLPVSEASSLDLSSFRDSLSGDVAMVSASYPDTPADRRISWLLWLLQKYAWGIGFAVEGEPTDVSLHVSAKVAAARAACDARGPHDAAKPFLLVVGDVSGIQPYIFGIASTNVGGGVAKRLRARSLFVQLLSDIAALQCLRACDPPVPLCNVLMASGGKFYLLLPNTEAVRDNLASAQTRMDRWLLDSLNAELGINLAWLEFDASGFGAGDSGFGDLVFEANRLRTERKSQLFKDILQRDGTWDESAFLREKTVFLGESVCRSCHRRPRTDDEVCDLCGQDKETGGNLIRAQYLHVYDKPSKPGAIGVLGWSVTLSPTPRNDSPLLSKGFKSWDVHALPDGWLQCAFLPIHVPVERGDVLPFEKIAEADDGRPQLAHLKADVDNAGLTFTFGFKRAAVQASLDTAERTVQLSFAFDMFFGGYLAHLLASQSFRCCYSVFGGGDDLYIIGPRETTLNLAERLATDFASYVANVDVHLSAGIVLCKPKDPVASVWRDAEDALERAKTAGRNRLSLFDHTLEWEQMFNLLEDFRRLKQPLSASPSSLLYRLGCYSALSRKVRENSAAWRYQALLVYDQRRNVSDDKQPDVARWMRYLASDPPVESPAAGIEQAEIIARLCMLGKGNTDGRRSE